MSGNVIGHGLDRTDGVLKTTGGARYAAEFVLPQLCHAVGPLLLFFRIGNPLPQESTLRSLPDDLCG